jgi:hypothetical protein
MRSRLRISIFLAFLLLSLYLIFPFARPSRHSEPPKDPPKPEPHPKEQINLEAAIAEFQQQFYDEHDALGK